MASTVVHDGNTLFVIDDTNLLLVREDVVEPEPEPEPAESRPGGRRNFEPSAETRETWESEARRLRTIREDDDLLVLL
jgi:hypothetical protein